MRKHLFATAINRDIMRWIGPDGIDLVTEDFMSFFKAKVMLNADCFVGLGSLTVQGKQRMALAANSGRLQS